MRIYTTQGRCLIGARRLPPTLNMRSVNPIARCSKASRGLFVQLWVESIFTPLAISPSPSLRQSLTRYAIRAGRNSIMMLHHVTRDDQTIPSSYSPALGDRSLHTFWRRDYSSHMPTRGCVPDHRDEDARFLSLIRKRF